MSSAMAFKRPSVEPDPFTEFNRRFAQILTSMESAQAQEAIAVELIDALSSLSPISVGGVWMHRPHDVPVSIYNGLAEMFGDDGLPRLDEYLAAIAFTVDPMYRAWRAGFRGCATVREKMPPGYEKSAFWDRFYASRNIVDELVHIVEHPDGRVVWCALARDTEAGHFSEDEVARHRAVYPAISAAVLRFDPFNTPPGESELADRIEFALESFGAGILTNREREIVLFVIQGHNSESISHQLDLSPDTIRLHRHNAYVKLGVNTQGELFRRFLESLH
jgi:DNA-binding CsgD family transcriptional regulator